MSKINNIAQLAEHFGTTPANIETFLTSRAGRDITVSSSGWNMFISTAVPACNSSVQIVCQYPFDSATVEAFLGRVGAFCDALVGDSYDDPFDWIQAETNPDEAWTLEDAGVRLSEAEANGWKFPPYVDAQFVLDLYNECNEQEEE